jgi:hypothetical protein
MLDYIIKGGVMMLPLVLCSVLALGVTLERLWSLRRKRVLRYDLLPRLEDLLREQKIPEAMSLCKRHQSTLTRILLAVLRHHDNPKTEIKEMIEENSRQEIPILERYLTSLGTIANTAPFLGLLGTVVKLLKIFAAIAQQDTQSLLSPTLVTNVEEQGAWGQVRLGEKQSPGRMGLPMLDPKLMARSLLSPPSGPPLPPSLHSLTCRGPRQSENRCIIPPLPQVQVATESESTLKFWVRPDGVVSRVLPECKGDSALEATAMRYLEE